MALQELIEVMNEQIALYENVVALAEEKRQAIVHNRLEELNRLVLKETKWIKQAGALEERRIFEMNRYIVGKGYRPSPNLTVADLAKIVVKYEEKQALLHAQKSLVAQLKLLKEKNDLNQQLVEHSLDLIQYSLDIIAGAPEDDATYSHPGQQQQYLKRPGVFDFRA